MRATLLRRINQREGLHEFFYIGRFDRAGGKHGHHRIGVSLSNVHISDEIQLLRAGRAIQSVVASDESRDRGRGGSFVRHRALRSVQRAFFVVSEVALVQWFVVGIF